MPATLPILGQAPAVEEDPLDLMDEIERLKKEKDATIVEVVTFVASRASFRLSPVKSATS